MNKYLTIANHALDNLAVADEKKINFRALVQQILQRDK
jgi:hypothetical protein